MNTTTKAMQEYDTVRKDVNDLMIKLNAALAVHAVSAKAARRVWGHTNDLVKVRGQLKNSIVYISG